MKKITLTLSIVILSAITFCANGQDKLTEGKITVEMTFPDSAKGETYLQTLGKERIIYFKGDNMRSEMKTSMGDVITIANSKTGETYVLYDLMGQKIAMKMTSEDYKKFKGILNVNPKVKLTKETKTIAGYNCRKAIVTFKFKGKKQSGDVWFTNDISVPNSPEFMMLDIDGYIMDCTFADKNSLMEMTCTSVEKTTVSADMFKIPDGYTIKSMSDMMNGNVK